jgi:hypothetical protein
MDLRISSPCPMSWDNLQGDDRVRFCGKCSLHVYNLAEMSDEEVERLVLKTEGRLCGRLYLRGDRTATAVDCPESRIRRRARILLTAGTLLLLAATSWFFRTQVRPDRSGFPPLVREVLNFIDPESPALAPMGIICPRTPPPPTPPPAPAPQTQP